MQPCCESCAVSPVRVECDAALLREGAISFIAGHAAEVMATTGWTDLLSRGNSGTLVSEVFAMSVGASSSSSSSSSSPSSSSSGAKRKASDARLSQPDSDEVQAVDGMSVTTLRQALRSRGLDAAGLKSQLVERLKGAIRVTQGQSGQLQQ